MTAAPSSATATWPDLFCAVPAAIDLVASWSPAQRTAKADGYADTIASGADVLWADPAAARRCETSPAQVEEALVTGLAILAYRPGGVSFGGLHWHAEASTCVERGCPGPGSWALPDAGTTREARGAFFTPRALADEIAWYAIGPHLDIDLMELLDLKIADIACGSGAFLVAAARLVARTHLQRWTIGDSRWFIKRAGLPDEHYDLRGPWGPSTRAAAMGAALDCLYGVDIDPLSVELARLALALLLPTEPTRLPNIRVGDALVGDSAPWLAAPTAPPTGAHRFDWHREFPAVFTDWTDPTSGFSVILGNPPYLGGLKLAGALGGAYREHLVRNIAHGRRGSADLAAYFWLRAHELVAEAGTVGIIGPTNLVRGANARLWQEHLRQVGHRRIYRSEQRRRWPSASAAVACCLLYTTGRLWIHPEFADHDEDDPGANLAHTCDFGIDPPRLGERWQPRAGCPRCAALAEATTAVIRVERDGQAYEVVRHRLQDADVAAAPAQMATTGGGLW